MKWFAATLAILFASSAQGNLVYDYVIDHYQVVGSLHDTETLLMVDQGGCDSLDLWDSSYARIEGTSPLKEWGGGVWVLRQGGQSRLEVLGGEIGTLSIGSDATAILSGGLIDQIESGQHAWVYEGDPPAPVWNPHIDILCREWAWDEPTNILTGVWEDYSPFEIQLVDKTQYGYDPAIENIRFTIIAEPVSLVLFGLGVLGLRRQSRA